ncbi:MAG: pentapeptide repeat-containing protein, partial [Chloroflexota bacterium]
MADKEHVHFLRNVDSWNKWREKTPNVKPNLRGIDLHASTFPHANFRETDLRAANLTSADLHGADFAHGILRSANLSEAKLRGASFGGADLHLANFHRALLRRAHFANTYSKGANFDDASLCHANFSLANLNNASFNRADLAGANFGGANLNNADFSNAYVCGVDFSTASLIGTKFEDADLRDCRVYGISAWRVNLKGAKQSNLIISTRSEPTITVDNLEVAQFLYLLLNNEKIRNVIDTIARKLILILGRFTPERKAVLDTIREELRKRDYLPVLFDFDKPATRDITETMRTLAHLSRFIVADISDPKSIPLELQAVIPDLAVPVQPLLLK